MMLSLMVKGERILRLRLPLLLSAPFILTTKDIKSVVYDGAAAVRSRCGRTPKTHHHLPAPRDGATACTRETR